jgi:SAM-dependent methyltransferase
VTEIRPSMSEYWNASAGDHWAANHERYDDLLGGYGRAAISALDVEADEHVLDVGCGAGGMTLDIARLLAPRGTVVGIDLSHQMIAVARERAGAEGLTNVEFVEGDVTTHPFEASSFHAFTSRFGVMFFEDPSGAFRHLAGLLAPGGRAAFVCWQTATANEWLTVPMGAIAQHVAGPPESDPNAPGPFAFADADRLRSILEAAGFEDVMLDPVSMDQRLGSDVDEAVAFVMGRSSVQALFTGAPDATREAAAASVRDVLGPHARDGGIFLSGAAWLVTGHLPA